MSFFHFRRTNLGAGGREGGREGGRPGERGDGDTSATQAASWPAAGVGAALPAGLCLAYSRWVAPGESLCCLRADPCTIFVLAFAAATAVREGHANQVFFVSDDVDMSTSTTDFSRGYRALGYRYECDTTRMSSVRRPWRIP